MSRTEVVFGCVAISFQLCVTDFVFLFVFVFVKSRAGCSWVELGCRRHKNWQCGHHSLQLLHTQRSAPQLPYTQTQTKAHRHKHKLTHKPKHTDTNTK